MGGFIEVPSSNPPHLHLLLSSLFSLLETARDTEFVAAVPAITASPVSQPPSIHRQLNLGQTPGSPQPIRPTAVVYHPRPRSNPPSSSSSSSSPPFPSPNAVVVVVAAAPLISLGSHPPLPLVRARPPSETKHLCWQLLSDRNAPPLTDGSCATPGVSLRSVLLAIQAFANSALSFSPRRIVPPCLLERLSPGRRGTLFPAREVPVVGDILR